MNAYERMLDLIDHEICSTGKREWDEEQVVLRIREIEAEDEIESENDGARLSDHQCREIAHTVLA